MEYKMQLPEKTVDFSFFDERGVLLPEKLTAYMDEVISKHVSPLVEIIAKSQSVDFGLEFDNLISIVSLANRTKKSLKNLSSETPARSDLINILQFLDWNNVQKNGMEISDSNYKPITIIDVELKRAHKHFTDIVDKITADNLTSELFMSVPNVII